MNIFKTIFNLTILILCTSKSLASNLDSLDNEEIDKNWTENWLENPPNSFKMVWKVTEFSNNSQPTKITKELFYIGYWQRNGFLLAAFDSIEGLNNMDANRLVSATGNFEEEFWEISFVKGQIRVGLIKDPADHISPTGSTWPISEIYNFGVFNTLIGELKITTEIDTPNAYFDKTVETPLGLKRRTGSFQFDNKNRISQLITTNYSNGNPGVIFKYFYYHENSSLFGFPSKFDCYSVRKDISDFKPIGKYDIFEVETNTTYYGKEIFNSAQFLNDKITKLFAQNANNYTIENINKTEYEKSLPYFFAFFISIFTYMIFLLLKNRNDAKQTK